MNQGPSGLAPPLIPVSWGELLDKISILEIKVERLGEEAARANAQRELEMLRAAAVLPALESADVQALVSQLRAINRSLWDVEARIREKDAAAAFDAEFIALARSVYTTNDARTAVKRQLNLLLPSGIVEEKTYRPGG